MAADIIVLTLLLWWLVRRRRPAQRKPVPVWQWERPGQGPRFFTPVQRAVLLQRGGYRCAWCGSTQRLECDHVIPYSRGGRTVISNGQILCHRCNMRKSNRLYLRPVLGRARRAA